MQYTVSGNKGEFVNACSKIFSTVQRPLLSAAQNQCSSSSEGERRVGVGGAWVWEERGCERRVGVRGGWGGEEEKKRKERLGSGLGRDEIVCLAKQRRYSVLTAGLRTMLSGLI